MDIWNKHLFQNLTKFLGHVIKKPRNFSHFYNLINLNNNCNDLSSRYLLELSFALLKKKKNKILTLNIILQFESNASTFIFFLK